MSARRAELYRRLAETYDELARLEDDGETVPAAPPARPPPKSRPQRRQYHPRVDASAVPDTVKQWAQKKARKHGIRPKAAQ